MSMQQFNGAICNKLIRTKAGFVELFPPLHQAGQARPAMPVSLVIQQDSYLPTAGYYGKALLLRWHTAGLLQQQCMRHDSSGG
jgi:hypothetical protein